MSYAQITKVPKVPFNLSLVALHAMAGHRLISPDGFAKMVEMCDGCYFDCESFAGKHPNIRVIENHIRSEPHDCWIYKVHIDEDETVVPIDELMQGEDLEGVLITRLVFKGSEKEFLEAFATVEMSEE
jgi:hypothetical protein